jgi:hypothetical protein
MKMFTTAKSSAILGLRKKLFSKFQNLVICGFLSRIAALFTNFFTPRRAVYEVQVLSTTLQELSKTKSDQNIVS